ncbi:hypothetical protein WJX79_001256 [Trebouxia sp. C0005]
MNKVGIGFCQVVNPFDVPGLTLRGKVGSNRLDLDRCGSIGQIVLRPSLSISSRPGTVFFQSMSAQFG